MANISQNQHLTFWVLCQFAKKLIIQGLLTKIVAKNALEWVREGSKKIPTWNRQRTNPLPILNQSTKSAEKSTEYSGSQQCIVLSKYYSLNSMCC